MTDTALTRIADQLETLVNILVDLQPDLLSYLLAPQIALERQATTAATASPAAAIPVDLPAAVREIYPRAIAVQLPDQHWVITDGQLESPVSVSAKDEQTAWHWAWLVATRILPCFKYEIGEWSNSGGTRYATTWDRYTLIIERSKRVYPDAACTYQFPYYRIQQGDYLLGVGATPQHAWLDTHTRHCDPLHQETANV